MDTEQTTETTTTETTGTETPSENPAEGSSTSTTTETTGTETSEGIDLAADTAATETTKETEDTRTDEEKAADEAAKAAHDELFGAPAEDAEYEIEGLPEGMTIDKEALDAVAPTFRELGLSNKGASKVAGIYAEKVLPHVEKQVMTGIEQNIITQRKEWEDAAVDAVKTNGAELKNAAGEALTFDGLPMEKVRAVAAKALDQIAPQGFREWLKETGLSVHPQMVAFAYQAGKRLAEDTEIEAHDNPGSKPDERRARRAGGLHPEKFYNR
jgi:hypothetical protein